MSPEIDLLTTLSTQPYSACEDQWNQLLRGLHLGGAYIPAIHAVLKEGRWKTQPNPIAYVRKSSVRVAARLGIVDVRPNGDREILASDLHYKDADGESLGHDDKLGTALYRHDEQFRAGVAAGFGSEYGSIYDEDYIGNRLPDSVMDENLEVDWDRVSQLAGMDAGERIVLDLQRIGFGRRAALAACYTDEDKKLLEAAWRRFDRKKETLKEVLQSGKAIPTRRQGVNAGDQ
ncbi:MAG: hypothetical protein ACXVJ0_07400, partial [Candidatus Angelobacter sp.]